MKRIVVVASEVPCPPLHGGRVETWRRIAAFKKMGFKLFLICWSNKEKTNQKDVEFLEKEVECLIILDKKNKPFDHIKRLYKILIGLPWQVSARIDSFSTENQIFEKIHNFNPDFILLDSLYGGDIALKISKKFNTTLMYRSHNIEHLYFKTQLRFEKKIIKKIFIFLASLNLRSYEFKIISESKYLLDISLDDMKFWVANGFENVRYFPPLADEKISEYADNECKKLFAHDILFLGNLNTPNNVHSLIWLINNVMPRVWRVMPNSILTIAGSSPCDEILLLVKKNNNIKLLPNVANTNEILNNSKILINPSLGGSGVNIKTIDMLMTKRPVVTTSFGVAGLSQDMKEICCVCDGHDEFANKIIFLLSDSVDLKYNKNLIDDNFSYKAFQNYCAKYFY